ncbi:hypothetical protein ScPMuIL_004188 [Solemya velum]
MLRPLPVLVCVGSIVLQVIAFATPGWFRIGSLNMGIWYMCIDGTCASYIDALMGLTIHKASKSIYTVGFLEFQIESTLGIIAGLIGTFLICSCNSSSTSNRKNAHICAVFMFAASGICSWIPTGKFAHLYSLYSLVGDLGVPYSIILMGCGATLAFVAALVIFVSISKDGQQQTTGQVLHPPSYAMQGVNHPQSSGYPPQGGYPAQSGQPAYGQNSIPPPKY